ncbi:MFS transporter [Streptomyces sp. TG1A-60]|uniref:MFS transporter n=1 Tax=Streptomyces sp. TG1A-60 TaxID=3129111 RepID=UPI0030CC3667
MALPVVTLHTTGDVRQAGLNSTALSVGIVLARLPAGVIADRYDHRNLLLVNNAIGAGLLGTLTLLLARDTASLWALLAAALLLGAVGSMLAPAETARECDPGASGLGRR